MNNKCFVQNPNVIWEEIQQPSGKKYIFSLVNNAITFDVSTNHCINSDKMASQWRFIQLSTNHKLLSGAMFGEA